MGESLSVPYDDVEQAQMRLVNTVIMVEGAPVLVMGVDKINGTIHLRYTDLPNCRNVNVISLLDESVNIRKFKLGYVNLHGEALYLRRTPAKQQQQGLSSGNVPAVTTKREGRRYTFEQIYTSGPFCDMMKNIYPSVNEALELFDRDEERLAVAIHKHFAIWRDRDLNFFELHYKGDRIAWGDPTAWNLPSHHAYMQDILRENNINFRN